MVFDLTNYPGPNLAGAKPTRADHPDRSTHDAHEQLRDTLSKVKHIEEGVAKRWKVRDMQGIEKLPGIAKEKALGELHEEIKPLLDYHEKVAKRAVDVLDRRIRDAKLDISRRVGIVTQGESENEIGKAVRDAFFSV